MQQSSINILCDAILARIAFEVSENITINGVSSFHSPESKTVEVDPRAVDNQFDPSKIEYRVAMQDLTTAQREFFETANLESSINFVDTSLSYNKNRCVFYFTPVTIRAFVEYLTKEKGDEEMLRFCFAILSEIDRAVKLLNDYRDAIRDLQRGNDTDFNRSIKALESIAKKIDRGATSTQTN